MNLYLVRHGRPLMDLSVPASRWELDPTAAPEIRALAECRGRLLTAVEPLLSDEHDVILVGHGTAWTVLAAALTGDEPDLERWQHLRMPDVITIPRLRTNRLPQAPTPIVSAP
ncbi:hypothetical protein GCM10028820_11050 [Tessaracoccus terricola]